MSLAACGAVGVLMFQLFEQSTDAQVARADAGRRLHEDRLLSEEMLGRVSWRFKTLEATWPFVLITSPTDRWLMTDTATGGEDIMRANHPGLYKVAGWLFVNKVGAGAFAGRTITANILMSLAVDHFGLFGMEVPAINVWGVLEGLLMVAGIALIAAF